jgi:hypothetical protein
MWCDFDDNRAVCLSDRALQVWGSFDVLHKALLKRKEEEQKYIDSQ